MRIARWQKLAIAGYIALLLLGGAFYTRWSHRNDPGEDLLSPHIPPGASSVDRNIDALQAHLRQVPTDGLAYGQLGAVYLQKARETGDPAYYSKAEAVLMKGLDLTPDDFEAMISLGGLALSRHQFREALTWAEKARVINPYRTSIYGIIGDAHIELGEYQQAFDTFEKMVNLRPDLSSYSRISYARELLGDTDGAIAAMRLAVETGASRAENTAWCRVQLGNLYFNYTNNLPAAEVLYRQALVDYPGYVYAVAGLARIRAAQGHYPEAISLYTRAVNTVPLPDFIIALGDVYRVAGESEAAAQQYALLQAVKQLFQANQVDMDLEMALFDVDHGLDSDQALSRAQEQMERRPGIKAADLLAWTLYQTGDYTGAQEAMNQALKLGTHDALMWFHAGMIAYRLGNYDQAQSYLKRTVTTNPNFSLLYAGEARDTLTKLTMASR
ncbi:MAG: tetratricopeptide repeat protein [Chloroflexi bacterium]|nr:tetratricopeptide repeat protein [Chloroflexota bacterium]